MDNNLAVIDPEKCINCGKCFEVCPTKSISTPENIYMHL
ncbi:MAG: 4Fe-4S binding protein [Eubacteriales bacterium]|nr:4Fe-4S binding protein [Eubacteriales bacterium]